MKHQNVPRSEYPRPQFRRDAWMNLNGEWDFEIDNAVSGKARGLQNSERLSDKIIVPFCPESKLSGIGNTDFMNAVWYKRDFEIDKSWLESGRRTIFHIGACDFETEVFINGKTVGTHIGGFSSFSFDITDFINEGKNQVTIYAIDDIRSGNQAGGKQSLKYHSAGCNYTRTTGIWQTVWIENVPAAYIKELKCTPCIDRGSVIIEAVCEAAYGESLCATAFFDGKAVGSATGMVSGKIAFCELMVDDVYLWSINEPSLYDLELTLGDDFVESYFGLREIIHKDGKFILNGETVFQRLILDQGYYPDGIYTAPSDDELKADITRSMDMGFNGARLHQKVFEPRFLYHCDLLGYIVWGEQGNWGLDISRPHAWTTFLPEWLEILKRDYNHPALVGWCPLNETQKNQDNRLVKMVSDMTYAYDKTRPVIDSSGWHHVNEICDILDVHDYEQDIEVFRKKYAELAQGKPQKFYTTGVCCPTFISEYGGVWWSDDSDESGWGYGNRPASKEEAFERFKALTETLLDCEAVGGFCYTQLTDVEQEQNGLYTYDRRPKFEPSAVALVVTKPAAVEINAENENISLRKDMQAI